MYYSITELAQAYRSKQFSPTEYISQLLESIKALDSQLNAFVLLTEARAMAEAEAAESIIYKGHGGGILTGIPYGIKDLFDLKDAPTQAGVGALVGNIKALDSNIAHHLHHQGAVIVGKTHTAALAYNPTGINEDLGTPHNPWHTEHHLPGGSSSGSAVATASGMVQFSVGTDTGGSVRTPAALCGITGLKLSHSRLLDAGLYPLSYSMDSIGWLTRSAEDAAHVLNAWGSGKPDASQRLAHNLQTGIRGMRIARPPACMLEGVDEPIIAAMNDAIEVFSDLGVVWLQADFLEAQQAIDLNYNGLIIAAEAYAINKGLLDEHGGSMDRLVVKRAIKGKDVPAWEYIRIMQKRAELVEQAQQTLTIADAWLAPTTMTTAMRHADFLEHVNKDDDTFLDIYRKYLRNTSIMNILDLCAISFPVGFSEGGLPIGLQLFAPRYHEEAIVKMAYAFQKATNWHVCHPPLGVTTK